MNMVENMLDQAFKKLNPHEHPVLHSDQWMAVSYEKISKYP